MQSSSLRWKLALIGFVFSESQGGFIYIIPFYIDNNVHFGLSEIGFVFSNATL